MTLNLIPDIEAAVGDWIRTTPEVIALDANVGGKLPDDFSKPWVRVHQLDARDVGARHGDFLLEYMVQLDCYAGKEAMDQHRGQAEASDLARTVRATLKAAENNSLFGPRLYRVLIRTHQRMPDQSFQPARERYMLDIFLHVRNRIP